jgi:tight adherence protein C
MTLPPLVSTASAIIAGGLFVALAALLWVDQRMHQRARIRHRFACASGDSADQAQGTALSVSSQVHSAFAATVRVANSLRFLGSGRRDQTQALLESAGFRGRTGVSNYFGVKLIASACGAVGAILGVSQGVFADNSGMQAALVLAGFFLGGLTPELVVRRIARRRQTAIRANLPDAIDLLIIATNAGQSLEELGRTAPVLADELQVTTSELRALPNRRQALENFATRTGVAEARSLTATLIQTVRYGTPLTQSLKVLAAEQRIARVLTLEEKAAKLPAILSLPLMLLIMPSIFIVTAGPALLSVGDALFGT